MYKVFWILQRSLKCLDLHTTNLGLLYNSVYSYLCTLYKCGRHLMTHEVLYCLAATSANWHCVLCCGKVSTDDSLGLVQMYVRMYEAVHSLLLIPRVASPMSSQFCAGPSLTESTSWSCPHLNKNLLLWSLQRCIHTVPWSMATQPCLSPLPTPLTPFTTHTYMCPTTIPPHTFFILIIPHTPPPILITHTLSHVYTQWGVPPIELWAVGQDQGLQLSSQQDPSQPAPPRWRRKAVHWGKSTPNRRQRRQPVHCKLQSCKQKLLRYRARYVHTIH